VLPVKPTTIQFWILQRLREKPDWVIEQSGSHIGMYDSRQILRRHIVAKTFDQLRDRGWIEPGPQWPAVNRWRISDAGRKAAGL
jgi:hypothetical protein